MPTLNCRPAGVRAVASSRYTHTAWIAFLCLALGVAASESAAVTLTANSADSLVHVEIVGTVGPFSQTDTSMALEPSLNIEEFRSGGNVGGRSFLTATINTGLPLPEVVVSSGDIARTGGFSNDTGIDYSYTLSFDLDGPALARLENGNSSSGFPRIQTNAPVDSASLTYELRAAGGATAFLYSAPETNSGPGTYAQAIIPAGSYEFVVTGSVDAIGDPCCVLHTSQAIGTVRLEFEDAPPPPPVPIAGPVGGSLLVGLLSAVGVTLLRRRSDGDCDCGPGVR